MRDALTNEEKLFVLGYQDGTNRGQAMKEAYTSELSEIMANFGPGKTQLHDRLIERYNARLSKLRRSIENDNIEEYAIGYVQGLDQAMDDCPELQVYTVKDVIRK